MQQAVLFEKLPEKKVKCTACSWYCKIPEGHTGICEVRKNIGGKLFLLVYGKAVAAHVDPIEKKPLFHFLPGTTVFSIGTVGCNFGCVFCQNWDTSQIIRELKKEGKLSQKESNNVGALGEDWPPEKIVSYCEHHSTPSMAFTYNEPTIFLEYALDSMEIGKPKGIKGVFVSNGFESKEAIKALKGNLDAINIDLKSFNESFYLKTCKAKLEPVLKSIEVIAKSKIWLEVTTLVIPGENDSDEELTSIAEFIAKQGEDIPWHISAFHPDYKMLDASATPKETLDRAFEIGKKAGLNYIYVGNILDPEHSNTHCPECEKVLIKRNYYEVEDNNLQDGCCKFCGQKIAGVWK